MTVHAWLNAAIADAQRRGLAPLVPLLETLARSTTALRAADLAERSETDRTGPRIPEGKRTDETA